MKRLSTLLIASLLVLSFGCRYDRAAVKADEDFHKAMIAPVNEYKANHPDQAQTFTDLMRQREREIAARKAVAR